MLSIKGNGSGIPSGVPGVYLNEARIIAVEDISGTTPKYYSNPVDIGVELKLEIGRSFQPTLRIAGNFTRDKETNAITAWGGATVVKMLLGLFGGDKLTDDYRIPPELITRMIGKDIVRLSYVKGVKEGGKLQYKDWNVIALKTADPADPLRLAEKFINGYKERGYPKDYHPDAIEQVSGAGFDFPPGDGDGLS